MSCAEAGVIYAIGVIISMALIMFIAAKFSAYLERKNRENKGDPPHSD